MHPILHVAVRAARRAGKIIVRHGERLERVHVREKGRNDFVSEVDRMAEDEIVEAVRRAYPRHRILAEERASDGEIENADEKDRAEKNVREKTPPEKNVREKTSDKKPDKKSPQKISDDMEWIIDPLDGTANYLHGHPHYAVSIAVREAGRLQHAVILDPLRDELFTASRGGGAHLNERRIRVTGQRKLARAMLATGFPFREHADVDAFMRRFRELLPRVSDMRRAGSAALDLAYVACGRLDGYWEPGLAAWDIAAGALLVREAGGLVADFSGGQDFLESGEVVAANRYLFNELLHCIAPRKSAAENAGPEKSLQ